MRTPEYVEIGVDKRSHARQNTVVASICSMMAGPASRLPGAQAVAVVERGSLRSRPIPAATRRGGRMIAAKHPGRHRGEP